MASPHPPQTPRHSFFASGPPIPFNLGGHQLHQPTAASYSFGGPGESSLNHAAGPSTQSPQQQNPFFVAWGSQAQHSQAKQGLDDSITSAFGGPDVAPSSVGRISLGGQISSPTRGLGSVASGKKRRPEEDEHGGPRNARLSYVEESGMNIGSRPIVGRRGGAKRVKGSGPDGVSASDDNVNTNDQENRIHQDVDVGVLLASLPPTTHLGILLSLMESLPSLKSTVIALIPALDVRFCLEDLETKARAIVSALPLGATSTRSATFKTSGIFGGADRRMQAGSMFGQSNGISDMAEGYVMNRLRAPINDFCSTAMVYLPFFSATAPNPPHATSIHDFIAQLTILVAHSVIPSFPPAATPPPSLTSLIEVLLKSWRGWVEHINDVVNKQGGMFAASVVEGWFKSIDELAKLPPGAVHATSSPALRLAEGIASAGNTLVREVGWLIGRTELVHRPQSANSAHHFGHSIANRGGRVSPSSQMDQTMDDEEL